MFRKKITLLQNSNKYENGDFHCSPYSLQKLLMFRSNLHLFFFLVGFFLSFFLSFFLCPHRQTGRGGHIAMRFRFVLNIPSGSSRRF